MKRKFYCIESICNTLLSSNDFIPVKDSIKSIKVICLLTFLLAFKISLLAQSTAEMQGEHHAEHEGIYELKIPGTNPVRTQHWYGYYKNGAFILVDFEDGERTSFDRISEKELSFSKTFQDKGRFDITFIKDNEEGMKQFRLQNDLAKMDEIVTQVGPLDDSKMDPGSSSDRLCYFERHYNKAEYMIPMRDGVKLYTQVFTPLGSATQNPFMLFRTPYGLSPYGMDFSGRVFPSLWFAMEDYILVYQEVRGTFCSEGSFSYFSPYIEKKESLDHVDESSDAFDTIEWLLENIPGNNGKVGVWGASYPGFTAVMAALSGHPAIAAVSSQSPMMDLFLGDDGHHNGALYLAHYINYLFRMDQLRGEDEVKSGLKMLRYPSPDAYTYLLGLGTLNNITKSVVGKDNLLWNQVMDHETFDDFWKSHSVNRFVHEIKPAMLTVGGWYDGEDLLGTLNLYKIKERNSQGQENSIVMGPWRHGWRILPSNQNESIGPFKFEDTDRYFQQQIELPFFNYYLKNKGDYHKNEAIVYETGTDKWRTFSEWPPTEAVEKKLFLAESGKLSLEPVTPSAGNGFDEYISNPAKPVPYTSTISTTYNKDYFVEDQRFASSRPDVLVYCSDVLSEDITITGAIKVEFYVSTTGTDADWVVKVVDVYPDNSKNPVPNPDKIRMGGYQRLIRGEIFRGKFRNSFEVPEPFSPGKVTPIKYELPDVQHTFLKGHRIMIQVQSSWFPLFDRNPQTFCNIRMAGKNDFQKANHRLYRSTDYPSGIIFKVISATQTK